MIVSIYYLQSAREKTGGNFRIQGLGYSLDHGREYAGAGASGVYVTSRAAPDDDESDDSNALTNPVLIEQLLGINKTLEKQIDTLRLRLDFDKRHHDAQKVAIIADTGCKIGAKNDEIKKLKEQLQNKDSKIQTLSEANEKKASEISELRKQIESLSLDVESAKSYANDLVDEMTILTQEKKKLESGGAFGVKDKEINELQKEIGDLKTNLATLEGELKKAHDVICSQSGQIKFLESDKKNIQLKFKEELAKVSQSMRLEVEKMRDVMKKQWEEMRCLREQNDSMSRDIKDIRNLLISGTFEDDAMSQKEVLVPLPTQRHDYSRNIPDTQLIQGVPFPPPQVQTSRGVKSQHSQGAFKPSLPILNKDVKKVITRKKWHVLFWVIAYKKEHYRICSHSMTKESLSHHENILI